MYYLFFFGGFLAGLTFMFIVYNFRSGFGYFSISDDPEDPDEGFINVRIPQNIIYRRNRIKRIILKKVKNASHE